MDAPTTNPERDERLAQFRDATFRTSSLCSGLQVRCTTSDNEEARFLILIGDAEAHLSPQQLVSLLARRIEGFVIGGAPDLYWTLAPLAWFLLPQRKKSPARLFSYANATWNEGRDISHEWMRMYARFFPVERVDSELHLAPVACASAMLCYQETRDDGRCVECCAVLDRMPVRATPIRLGTWRGAQGRWPGAHTDPLPETILRPLIFGVAIDRRGHKYCPPCLSYEPLCAAFETTAPFLRDGEVVPRALCLRDGERPSPYE